MRDKEGNEEKWVGFLCEDIEEKAVSRSGDISYERFIRHSSSVSVF